MLSARSCFLQVDIDPSKFRLDGTPYTNATPNYPGVILTIDTRKHGVLTYPCNAFNRWQDNVRAIALGLEALRKVERYGIAERGQQYAGFAKLGSGIPMGPSQMTVQEAAAFIVKYCDDPFGREFDIADDPLFATALFSEAAFRLHPDHGGDPELFDQLVKARDFLEATA